MKTETEMKIGERIQRQVIIVKSGGDKHYGEWKKKQANAGGG